MQVVVRAAYKDMTLEDVLLHFSNMQDDSLHMYVEYLEARTQFAELEAHKQAVLHPWASNLLAGTSHLWLGDGNTVSLSKYVCH
jgi:hypothetical protein